MSRPVTIFEALDELGHDEDFEPRAAGEPTAARAGTKAKLEVLAERVRRGEDLWHPGDGTGEELGLN